MQALVISLEHERATLDLSLIGETGNDYWFPSDTSLDVRIFAQKVGAMYLIEREAGNCSLVVGHPEKSKPRFQCGIRDVAPDGWSIADPRGGQNPYDWPMGRASWRRYVVYQGGPGPSQTRDEALRLAMGDFVDNIRQVVKSYGPYKLPLPTLGTQQRTAIQNADSASFRMVQNALLNKTSFHVEDWSDGVASPWNGWMPMGPSDPGEVGGTGIYFFTGWRQNIADLRRAMLIAQCEHERMKHWYRRDNGHPISTEDYPGQTPDLWGYPVPPEAMIPNDGGGGGIAPPYDFAHEIRGYRRTVQFAEQAGSAMAKFSVRSLSSLARLRFSHRARPSQPGYYPLSLRTLMDAANQDPNNGIFGAGAGRMIGWSALEVAWSAKLSGWLGESREWAQAFLAFVNRAVPPAGPIQKCKAGAGGWPLDHFATQTFEDVILAYGVASLAIQLGVDVPIFVHRVLENIYGPNTQVPILSYSGATVGPAHYIQSADDAGKAVERLTTALPNAGGAILGDPAHALAGLALAASLDPNPSTWVERGIHYGAVFPDVQSKLNWLTSGGATEISWDAAWVAQAQKVTAASA